MGILICFTLPGILIGLLLAQSFSAKKTRPCSMQEKHGRDIHKGNLYIHDLRGDYAATTSRCA